MERHFFIYAHALRRKDHLTGELIEFAGCWQDDERSGNSFDIALSCPLYGSATERTFLLRPLTDSNLYPAYRKIADTNKTYQS